MVEPKGARAVAEQRDCELDVQIPGDDGDAGDDGDRDRKRDRVAEIVDPSQREPGRERGPGESGGDAENEASPDPEVEPEAGDLPRRRGRRVGDDGQLGPLVDLRTFREGRLEGHGPQFPGQTVGLSPPKASP